MKHQRDFKFRRISIAAMIAILFMFGCEKQRARKDTLQRAIPHVMLGVSLDTDGKIGMKVKSVLKNSPAGYIELREGDRITHIGEQGISQAKDVTNVLAKTTPGITIQITVQRNGSLISAKLKPILVYFPYQSFTSGFEINKFCDSDCNCTLDQPGFFCITIYRYIGEGPNGGVLLQKICVATEGPGQPEFPTACEVHEYF